jgi:hypothetical protein
MPLQPVANSRMQTKPDDQDRRAVTRAKLFVVNPLDVDPWNWPVEIKVLRINPCC